MAEGHLLPVIKIAPFAAGTVAAAATEAKAAEANKPGAKHSQALTLMRQVKQATAAQGPSGYILHKLPATAAALPLLTSINRKNARWSIQ
jgi:hypothetical protein